MAEITKYEPGDIAKSLRTCLVAPNCDGCILLWEENCIPNMRRVAAEAIESLLEENAGLVGDLMQRNMELLELKERWAWRSTEDAMPDEELRRARQEFPDSDVEVLAVVAGARRSTALFYDGSQFYAIEDGGECVPYKVERWMPMPEEA